MNSTQIGPTGRVRSDADSKKLIRKTRKFAMTLLNLFCTENQRKGYSDEKMHELYKRCFDNGFLLFFAQNHNYSEESQHRLFIDFLNLSFPLERIKNILNIHGDNLSYQEIAMLVLYLKNNILLNL